MTFVPDHLKKRIVENVSVFKQRSNDFPAAKPFRLIKCLPDGIHFICLQDVAYVGTLLVYGRYMGMNVAWVQTLHVYGRCMQRTYFKFLL